MKVHHGRRGELFFYVVRRPEGPCEDLAQPCETHNATGLPICRSHDRKQEQLAMLTAGAIMTSDIITIRPEASLEDAIALMLSEQISGLPVIDDDGRLVGVITEFALLAVAYDQRVKNHTVRDHMTTELIMVDINDPISRVADLCIVHRVRRVPVMQNGRLVGVIARRDVLRALVDSPAAVCTA
jgi:CBS domain-containing protein